jgi:hypothetical protein
MKYLAVLLIAIFSTHLLAQPTWHTSKISRVYPQADGRFVVIFESDNLSCTNANNPKYYYVGVGLNGVTEAGLTKIYSALLTAGASGREVTINFDSSSAYCEINRVSVSFQ